MGNLIKSYAETGDVADTQVGETTIADTNRVLNFFAKNKDTIRFENKTIKWDFVLTDAMIKNGIEGKYDNDRNCPMCCLKAFASNLLVLYPHLKKSDIKTNDIMSTALSTLKKDELVSSKIKVPPFYQGKRLTSKSHSEVALEDIESKISDRLLELTPDKSICVFAVGIAAEYHSTLIIVSKDTEYEVDLSENGTEQIYSTTNDNPLFVFVEDNGGSRYFNASDLDNKISEFINGAYEYYRGEKEIQGARGVNINIDYNLDANVYQLFYPNQ